MKVVSAQVTARPLRLTAAVIVFAGLLPISHALSATRPAFVAASTADAVDTTPGDGVCDSDGDTADDASDCTLRAAVMEANALGGPDEIDLLPNATYLLTIPNGLEDDGYDDATGDLDVTDPIAIVGGSKASSVVDAGNQFEVPGGPNCDPADGLDDRVFDVSTDGDASFSGFGIEGGNAPANNAAGVANGGGIRNRGGLILDEMGVGSRRMRLGCYSNTATVGGGLFSSGKAVVVDSLDTHGLASAGGGLAVADGGRVRIDHSRIGAAARHTDVASDLGHNHAMCAGGGVYNASTARRLKIHHRSTIVGDSAGNLGRTSCLTSGLGGGIYNQGRLYTHDLWVTANFAHGGGGMWNQPLSGTDPTVTLASTRFVWNQATGDGGGLANVGGKVELRLFTGLGSNVAGAGGGGIKNQSTCDAQGDLLLNSSGLGGNTALGDASTPGIGGGILNEPAPESCPASPALPSKVTLEYASLRENVAGQEGVSSGLGGAAYNGGIMEVRHADVLSSAALGDGGSPGKGGGFYNESFGPIPASLVLDDVQLGAQYDEHVAGANSATQGGGIYNEARPGPDLNTVDVTESSISWNVATDGAGLYNNTGDVSVMNSTFSTNQASGKGGGIYAAGDLPEDGATTLDSVTVARNSAGQAAMAGDGIFQIGDHDVSFQNTIVAQNPQPKSSGHLNCSGNFISRGYNVDDDGTCDLGATEDQPNVSDAGLGELRQNGDNTTETHALTPTSPAVDAGVVTGCPATDQRGYARPKDGDRDGTPRCDVGAYERDPLDTDGDGYQDAGDHCDTVPGDFNGCPGPETDHGPDGDLSGSPSPSPSSPAPPPTSGGGGGGGGAPPDGDHDGVQDSKDNCAVVSNFDQGDADKDGAGDACDEDDDGDAVADASDNCPGLANDNQADRDADGAGDACDPDDDNDGALDGADNCPVVANGGQSDADGDGAGDACDPDFGGGGGETFDVSVTLHYGDGKFAGGIGVLPSSALRPDRTASPAGSCGSGRHVDIYKVRPGSDSMIGRALSNARFKYHYFRPGAEGKFYVRVAELQVNGTTCEAARSRKIVVGN